MAEKSKNLLLYYIDVGGKIKLILFYSKGFHSLSVIGEYEERIFSARHVKNKYASCTNMYLPYLPNLFKTPGTAVRQNLFS